MDFDGALMRINDLSLIQYVDHINLLKLFLTVYRLSCISCVR